MLGNSQQIHVAAKVKECDTELDVKVRKGEDLRNKQIGGLLTFFEHRVIQQLTACHKDNTYRECTNYLHISILVVYV